MQPTVYANGANIYQFKVIDSEIKPYIFCLGNILNYFTVDNVKKWIEWKAAQFFC